MGRVNDLGHESERRLSALIRNLPGMVYRCRNNHDWTMQYVSEGCYALTGYPPSDLVENSHVSFGELIHPDDRETVWRQVQEAVAKKRLYRLTYRIVNATGDERWVWDHGGAFYSESGDVIALEGFIADITERKLAEGKLQESETRFRRLTEAQIIGIIEADLSGNITSANDIFLTMTGYSRTDLPLRWDRMTPEEWKPLDERAIEQLSAHGVADPWEKEYYRKDGSRISVLVGVTMLDRAQGSAISYVLDLTEQKLAESRLRYWADFEHLIAGISTRLLNIYPEEVDAGFDQAFKEIAGFIGADRCMLGEYSDDHTRFSLSYEWCGDGIPPLKDSMQDITTAGFPYVTAKMLRGEPVISSELSDLPPEALQDRTELSRLGVQSLVLTPVFDASEVIGFFALQTIRSRLDWPENAVSLLGVIGEMFINALMRKHSETELKKSEQRFKTLVEYAPEAVVVFDVEQWYWVAENSNAVRLFGLDREASMNKHLIEDLSPPLQPDGRMSIDAAQEYIQEALAGRAPVFEWMHRDARGKEVPCEIRLVKLPGEGRRLVRASITDISERKRVDARLRESRRQLEQAQRIAHLGSWSRDLVTQNVTYSSELFRIFGMEPDQPTPTYEQFQARVHPDDLERVDTEVKRSERDGKPFNCEYRILRPDGEVRTIHDQARVITDASGTPTMLVGTVLDVTVRKMVEEELREAHAEVERLKERLEAENIYLQEEIKTEHNFEEIIGNSALLQKALKKIEQVAPTDTTVLIRGESGTGKELFTRAIHSRSGRSDRPLVKVNCGAIPENLIESELFGHEKGAFTGATQARAGRFELADGGTIFLDEIGELPLDAQVKLLRVLQEQEFERVGGSKSIKINVRVLAATNKDLGKAIAAGTFRQDLYYRLDVFPITIPALRERAGDVPMLVDFFISRYATQFGKDLQGVSAETMELLESYSWPGNVRELQNIVERASILSDGPIVKIDRSSIPSAERVVGKPVLRTLDEVERDYIVGVLKETNWVISGQGGAANILDLHPNTLRSRMGKLGIQRPS